MVILRNFQQKGTQPTSKRRSHFIDREFQLRYVAVVVIAAGFGMLVSIGPAYYFLNQNYQIFADLAFEHSPDLLEDLRRERHWVNMILGCGVVATLAFFGLLSFKMTSRMTGPLKVLRNHLKWLSRGRWDQAPLKVRETDEFQDLIEAYNYFYNSFRTNLSKDLQRLHKFNIEIQNRDAHKAWLHMIEEKSIQLGVEENLRALNSSTSGSSASNAESRDLHRVS